MEGLILNCITVDDEPPALSLVSAFVDQTPFLRLLGKFDSALKALEIIHSQQVHLVFLDIQMPNLNGIELATALNGQHAQTRVIFTTAHNQFATESYQAEALNYLLKPYAYSEFLKAADKARDYFMELFKHKISEIAPLNEEFMFIKSDYKLVRVDFDSILYIESLNGYVKIHLTAPASPILSSASLRDIEVKLPAYRFARLHRSFVVPINKIKAIGKNSVQIGNNEIPIGELYKESFREFLAKWS